nr:uncharacterized protein LOC100055688 isoform X2 [Equus caballus]XP_023499508.1 uncharacterized protein LOC100055688 isoform X2 [Equus caballus]
MQSNRYFLHVRDFCVIDGGKGERNDKKSPEVHYECFTSHILNKLRKTWDYISDWNYWTCQKKEGNERCCHQKLPYVVLLVLRFCLKKKRQYEKPHNDYRVCTLGHIRQPRASGLAGDEQICN